MKWIVAYIAAAVAFGALDAVYLRWAADNLYRPVIGSILADEFRMGAAIAFYLIYIAGVVWFAVKSGLEAGNVGTALINGALLGGLCYATFDLTSQAVMKVWSTHLTLIDIAWGAFATGVATAVATWAAIKIAS